MKRLLFAVAILLAWPLLAHAQISYYVSTTGNDANNGLSPATPWRTIQNAVNSISYSVTANIYLQQGSYGEAVSISTAGPGPNSNLLTCYGGAVTTTSVTVSAANWTIAPCINGGMGPTPTPTPALTPTPTPAGPTGTPTPVPASGGVNHVVTGSSVSMSCTPGAPWDSYEQNPLTANVSITLPNSCPSTYSTVAYLATQGSGAYTISITAPTTLFIDAPGSGGNQVQIGATAGNTLWLVFHWDNLNGAWHELGMAPFPPLSAGQSLSVYSGSGANAIPLASTVAHTFACVSDAAACTNGVTYAAGGGSTVCHVHSDGTSWIEDGFGC